MAYKNSIGRSQDQIKQLKYNLKKESIKSLLEFFRCYHDNETLSIIEDEIKSRINQ